MVNLGKQHLQTARRNEVVAGWLAYTPFCEWAVTALFYAALQLVDSYLVGVKSVTSLTHDAMAANVKQDCDLSVAVARVLADLAGCLGSGSLPAAVVHSHRLRSPSSMLLPATQE